MASKNRDNKETSGRYLDLWIQRYQGNVTTKTSEEATKDYGYDIGGVKRQ